MVEFVATTVWTSFENEVEWLDDLYAQSVATGASFNIYDYLSPASVHVCIAPACPYYNWSEEEQDESREAAWQ